MDEQPVLTCVLKALPEPIQALSHVVHVINEMLVPETIDAAVYNDCHYIIRVHGATRRWTTKATDEAATRGRLDLVKWLSVVRSEGCTVAALDGATRNGHFKVVKWLCHHFVDRCSNSALNAAANNGHGDVVKYLCRRNRSRNHEPYVITTGVQAIARLGDVGTLCVLLRESCSWYFTGRALEEAAGQGLTDIVKLLLSVRLRQTNVSRALKNAVAMKHIEIVELLADLCSSTEIRDACKNLKPEPTSKLSELLRKILEKRDVEEKWGYFRTQLKTLEQMKALRTLQRSQEKAVSFCGLLRSW